MSDTKSTQSNTILPVSSFMIETLSSTFELAKGGGVNMSLAIAGKALSIEKMTSEISDHKMGKAVGFVSDEVLQTLNLMKLAEQSNPNMIIATIGATFIKKMATAFSFAGDDSKQAALIGAYADVIGQSLAMGVSVTEAIGTGGVTVPLAVLNGLALIVAAKKAYDATSK